MAELAVYLVAYGIVYGVPAVYREARFVAPAVRQAAQRLALSARRRLDRVRTWRGGPSLGADEVLAQVGRANATLRRAAVSTGDARRFVLQPVWAPGGVPALLARLRGAPVVRGAGALHGEVVIAVERVPVREESSAHAGEGEGEALDEGELLGKEGFVLLPAESEVRPRRATLRQLFEFLVPALAQVRAELEAEEGGEGQRREGDGGLDDAAAGAAGSALTAAATAAANETPAGRADDEGLADDVCCICMDGINRLAAPCGHAFCETCYVRWRQTADDCPLCRATLPTECFGDGAWLLTTPDDAAMCARGGGRETSAGAGGVSQADDPTGCGAYLWVRAFFDKLPPLLERA